MKQFLKYILLLFVSVLLLVNLIAASSFYMMKRGSFYKPSFLSNGVNERTFDYIILGASNGLTTLNTKIIDSVSGFKGLNLAIDDTGIPNHYLMLQHFLEEGKRVKYCILVPSLAGMDKINNELGDNDYRFLMYLNRPYVSQYYKSLQKGEVPNIVFYSKWMPFIGLSYYNTELFFPSLLSAVNPNKRNRFDTTGNYTYPNQKGKLQSRDKVLEEIKFNNPYLSKIEKLCYENDIKLIYYFSPNRIKKLSFNVENKNLINHSNSFKYDSYFYDDIHVNRFGNKKASLLFIDDFIKIKDSLALNKTTQNVK